MEPTTAIGGKIQKNDQLTANIKTKNNTIATVQMTVSSLCTFLPRESSSSSSRSEDCAAGVCGEGCACACGSRLGDGAEELLDGKSFNSASSSPRVCAIAACPVRASNSWTSIYPSAKCAESNSST